MTSVISIYSLKQKALYDLLKQCAENQRTISQLEKTVVGQQGKINQSLTAIEQHKKECWLLERSITHEQAHLKPLKETTKKMQDVFDAMQKKMTCTSCKDVALLPKVTGKCGHISCQHCLQEKEKAAFPTKAKIDSFAYLDGRSCLAPQCGELIAGDAIPVLPLKNLALLLLSQGFIRVSEDTVQKSRLGTVVNFIPLDKVDQDTLYFYAIKLRSWSYAEQAKHMALQILSYITRDQWAEGVYFRFPDNCYEVFMAAFSHQLKRRGRLNVGFNRSTNVFRARLKDSLIKEADTKEKASDKDVVMKAEATKNTKGILVVEVKKEGTFTCNRLEAAHDK